MTKNQISADRDILRDIQTIGTGQIRVFSVAYLQFAPFADIIMRNRIFKCYRPIDLWQLSKVWITFKAAVN